MKKNESRRVDSYEILKVSLLEFYLLPLKQKWNLQSDKVYLYEIKQKVIKHGQQNWKLWILTKISPISSLYNSTSDTPFLTLLKHTMNIWNLLHYHRLNLSSECGFNFFPSILNYTWRHDLPSFRKFMFNEIASSTKG